MELALIGLGSQTTNDHLPAILKLQSQVQLACIVDSDITLLERYKRELNVPAFLTVQEMLSYVIPNVAVVAVPHNAYVGIIGPLLKANVHVIKEKPLATSLEEAHQIVELANMSSAQVFIAAPRRFRESAKLFHTIREEIGSLRFVQANYLIPGHRRYSGWRSQHHTAGGGCLLDMGYHLVDLLIWYFGLPQLLSCVNGSPQAIDEVEDVSTFWAHYSDQRFLCSALISDSAYAKNEYIELTGARGIIKIQKELVSVQGKALNEREMQFPSQDCALAQLKHFLQIVSGDVRNDSTPTDHLQHMAFISSAYRSARSGRAEKP